MAIQDSLICAYTYEDNTNLGKDYFAGLDLTNNNGVTQATGKISKAGSFASASNQYLRRTSSADFVVANTSWELITWVNFTSLPGAGNYPGIAGKWGGGGLEYLLYWNGDDSAIHGVMTSDGSTQKNTTHGGISTGTWYFLDLYFDYPNTTLYLRVNDAAANGVSSIAVTNTYSGTSAFVIGSTDFLAPWHNGLIDGTHLYKRLLTSSERTDVYLRGIGREFPFRGVGRRRISCG